MWIAALFALSASTPAAPPEVPAPKYVDERPDIGASGYFGLAIDSFAASDLRQYLNPNSSGQTEEQFVGGIDVAYRLVGGERRGSRQLWIYGETMHGLRSSEVDCQSTPELEVCQPFEATVQSPSLASLYLLRKATSLEAFAGLRYEFALLNSNGEDAAKLYAKAQAGFLSVAGSGGDVMDSHHVGLGVLAVAGRFEGSYLEVGVGQSDVFQAGQRRRVKLDALLSLASKKRLMRPFAQITIDSDFGAGADSIQTYLGVDVDLGRIFGGGQ